MAPWVGSLPEAGMSVHVASPCSCSRHLPMHPTSGGGVPVCFILFVFNVVSSGFILLPNVSAVESWQQKFPPFSFSVFSPSPEAGSCYPLLVLLVLKKIKVHKACLVVHMSNPSPRESGGWKLWVLGSRGLMRTHTDTWKQGAGETAQPSRALLPRGIGGHAGRASMHLKIRGQVGRT